MERERKEKKTNLLLEDNKSGIEKGKGWSAKDKFAKGTEIKKTKRLE